MTLLVERGEMHGFGTTGMRAGCGVQELGRGYLIGWDGWALSARELGDA